MNLLHINDAPGKHAPSWYSASCPAPNYPTLVDDIQRDVCVVGAGYTGLSAALHLQRQGHSVALLDAHRVAWGASGRNGGQLGSGLNADQSELESQYGIERAQALWRLCEQAKHTIHTLCREHAIDAQYKPGIIEAMHRPRFVADSHRYCDKLAKEYNYPHLQPLSKLEIRDLIDSPNYHGGAIDHGAGHIHPMALGVGLANAVDDLGGSIYELSRVNSIKHKEAGSSIVRTDKGSVKAERIVLACNGYLDNLEPAVQQRVMPINNFIVATEPLGERAQQLLPGDHAVYDSRFVVNYFRLSSDKRLLFGGGETYSYQFPSDIESLVRKPMLQVFPQLHDVRIDYSWGGTLAITRSRLPFVRQIKPNVYSASGYSGHGVALAVEAGKVIAEAINGNMGNGNMGNRNMGNGNTEDFDALSTLKCGLFPGGSLTRSTLLKGAMSWYAFRDKF